jgi:hypothetical protein
MSAPFAPRRHKFANFVDHNHRARKLLESVVPGYFTLAAIADRVGKRAEALNATVVDSVALPTTLDEVEVDSWIDRDVLRRMGAEETNARLRALRELEFERREAALDLIDDHTDDLFLGLDDQLQDLVEKASAAVDEMGPSVRTASDAIKAGRAEEWKTVDEQVPALADIRACQRALNQCVSVEFDGARCGDAIAGGDPDARLYHLKNLDEVAPRWRGYQDSGGTHHLPEYPWPTDDPTEKLVWFIRNDAGLWCPTPGQVRTLLSGAVPPRLGKGYRGNNIQQMKTEHYAVITTPVVKVSG